MKIFSNFDTNRKQDAYNEAIKRYWKENVLILSKSKLFLFMKVIFPILGWLILFVAFELIIYFFLNEITTVAYILMGILVILYIIIISPTCKYFIDYKMDFSLVTPEYLTRYNQSWWFKRDIKSSDVQNIKTITVLKNDFLYNITNNGNLIFLSEWARTNEGEIILHYIKNPEEKKKEIERIMKVLNNVLY